MLQMPLNHVDSRTVILLYKVESYEMAADVYAGPGPIGRGGGT